MSTYDLIDINEVKSYLSITDADISENAISLYCYDSDATAATAEVIFSDVYAQSLSLVITGGNQAGTITYDLDSTGSDTSLGLARTIQDTTGWSARLVGSGDYPSSDLELRAATACNTSANEITLTVEDNSLIQMLINHASILIEKELGFNVLSRSYTETHNGDGEHNIWLENFPVTGIAAAYIDRDDVMTVKYSAGDASYATCEITDSALNLRSTISGTESTDTITLSDYATVTLLAVAINDITGWSATVITNYGTYYSADIIKVPAHDANDRSVTLEVPDQPEYDLELTDPDKGRLYNPYGWSKGNANIVIKYTAGYSTVPKPIESACLELVKMMFDASKKDSTLKSEKIGDYSYTVADRLDTVFSASGDAKTSNMIMLKLRPYIRDFIFGV